MVKKGDWPADVSPPSGLFELFDGLSSDSSEDSFMLYKGMQQVPNVPIPKFKKQPPQKLFQRLSPSVPRIRKSQLFKVLNADGKSADGKSLVCSTPMNPSSNTSMNGSLPLSPIIRTENNFLASNLEKSMDKIVLNGNRTDLINSSKNKTELRRSSSNDLIKKAKRPKLVNNSVRNVVEHFRRSMQNNKSVGRKIKKKSATVKKNATTTNAKQNENYNVEEDKPLSLSTTESCITDLAAFTCKSIRHNQFSLRKTALMERETQTTDSLNAGLPRQSPAVTPVQESNECETINRKRKLSESKKNSMLSSSKRGSLNNSKVSKEVSIDKNIDSVKERSINNSKKCKSPRRKLDYAEKDENVELQKQTESDKENTSENQKCNKNNSRRESSVHVHSVQKNSTNKSMQLRSSSSHAILDEFLEKFDATVASHMPSVISISSASENMSPKQIHDASEGSPPSVNIEAKDESKNSSLVDTETNSIFKTNANESQKLKDNTLASGRKKNNSVNKKTIVSDKINSKQKENRKSSNNSTPVNTDRNSVSKIKPNNISFRNTNKSPNVTDKANNTPTCARKEGDSVKDDKITSKQSDEINTVEETKKTGNLNTTVEPTSKTGKTKDTGTANRKIEKTKDTVGVTEKAEASKSDSEGMSEDINSKPSTSHIPSESSIARKRRQPKGPGSKNISSIGHHSSISNNITENSRTVNNTGTIVRKRGRPKGPGSKNISVTEKAEASKSATEEMSEDINSKPSTSHIPSESYIVRNRRRPKGPGSKNISSIGHHSSTSTNITENSRTVNNTGTIVRKRGRPKGSGSKNKSSIGHHVSTSTSTTESVNNTTTKKRGRPKGSKNKRKGRSKEVIGNINTYFSKRVSGFIQVQQDSSDESTEDTEGGNGLRRHRKQCAPYIQSVLLGPKMRKTLAQSTRRKSEEEKQKLIRKRKTLQNQPKNTSETVIYEFKKPLPKSNLSKQKQRISTPVNKNTSTLKISASASTSSEKFVNGSNINVLDENIDTQEVSDSGASTISKEALTTTTQQRDSPIPSCSYWSDHASVNLRNDQEKSKTESVTSSNLIIHDNITMEPPSKNFKKFSKKSVTFSNPSTQSARNVHTLPAKTLFPPQEESSYSDGEHQHDDGDGVTTTSQNNANSSDEGQDQNAIYAHVNNEVVALDWIHKMPSFSPHRSQDVTVKYSLTNLKSNCGTLSCGYIKFEPGQRKIQVTKKHSILYKVEQGQAAIRIQLRDRIADIGSFFYIPISSLYSIENLSQAEPLILSFNKLCAS